MYAHTVSAAKPGSFNTELNMILLMNNLPKMKFLENPPSFDLLTRLHQASPVNQMETTEEPEINNSQETTLSPQTIKSQERKRKLMNPRTQLTSGQLHLNVFIDPSIHYNIPKTATKKLPTNKYKFTYSNEDYDRDEIKELLQNQLIQIHPDSITIQRITCNSIHTNLIDG